MKKINIIFWYLFLMVFLEIIYKVFVWNTFFDIHLLVIIFFSIPFALFFYLINNIWNSNINKILNIIWTISITIIFLAQYIYYQFYKSIFSIKSATMGVGQVFGEFSSAVIDYLIRNYIFIIIVFIPLILFLIFKNKIFESKRYSNKYILIITIIFILSFISNLIYLNLKKEGLYSEYRLYYKVHAPMITINRFGLLTMESLDLFRTIFGFTEEFCVEDSNFQLGLTDKYNALNIDFESMIKQETNDLLKNMHIYFKNQVPSEKNEYTSMLEGKNLIFITAESLDVSAIREDTAPTLYKLVNNGFVFNNYYQPLYPVSTLDGEYMNITSLLPKEGVWSLYESSFISMPYGLGNVFKDMGYKTNAYHNHSYNYYNRQLSHPNLGFEYLGCGNGIETKINCNIWPESDLEMIEKTIDDYINNDKFVTYYMSVSGHLRYNDGNSMVEKNYDKVKELKYSENVKSYLAANIELDKALEYLIKRLEAENKLDDTFIVIAPDHYPYGLTVDELNEISKNNRDDKFELYHTSLIMYNPNIEKTIVNDYVSSLDILPTLYNLFGVKYDSRLLMGTDVFSSLEKTVVLSDRSFITNQGKYDTITNKFTSFNETVNNEYVKEIIDKIDKKFVVSSNILNTNYYSYLGDL